jgi:hypothetical protein
VPPQSDNDETTISLWLHGRSTTTRRAYESDAQAFLAMSGKSLPQVTVGDVQAYAAASPAWLRRRRLAGARP